MYHNSLTNRYMTHVNQPIQFMRNSMLDNNPIFASNIYDPSFCQRMMMQKEEQLRKIKSVSDLGMTQEQLRDYVIAPIKIQASDSSEIAKLIDDEEKMLTEKFIEENWWKQRTNAPYKNILKDEDWKRSFKSKDDLIVHKVTNLDKIGLMKEYEALMELIEKHNGELKIIYHASKENEYKKAFKFVQKLKYRVQYDPKDYNDLKNLYKKEQKKFERDQRRLEDTIARLMDDEIDVQELKQVESEFSKPSKNKKNKSKEIDEEKEIDRQIQELIDEYGEKIIKELGYSSDDNSDDGKNRKRTKKEKKDRGDSKNKRDTDHKSSREDSRKHDKDSDSTSEDKKPRARIVRKIQQDEDTTHDNKNDNASSSEHTKRIRIKRIGPDTSDKSEPEKRYNNKSDSSTDSDDDSRGYKRDSKRDDKGKDVGTDTNIRRIRITRRPVNN